MCNHLGTHLLRQNLSIPAQSGLGGGAEQVFELGEPEIAQVDAYDHVTDCECSRRVAFESLDQARRTGRINTSGIHGGLEIYSSTCLHSKIVVFVWLNH